MSESIINDTTDSTDDVATANAVVADIVTLNLHMPRIVRVPMSVAKGTVEYHPVDVAQLPDVTVAFLFNYGLRQCLNDAKATAKTPAEARAMFAKRLDKLVAGSVGTRGRQPDADPVTRKARQLAKAEILAAIKAAIAAGQLSGKASDYADQADEMVADYIDTNPDIVTRAETIVAAESAATRSATPAAAGLIAALRGK